MITLLILIFLSNLIIAGAIVFSKLYHPKTKEVVVAPQQESVQDVKVDASYDNAMMKFALNPAIAKTMQSFYGLDISDDTPAGDK